MSTQRAGRYPSEFHGRSVIAATFGILVALIATVVPVARADHEGINLVTFAAVDGSPAPNASGTGQMEYHGGVEPVSRWTSTFAFAGLEPETTYVVMVMGRAGEDGSAAAQAESPICAFESDAAGSGHCWDYELGMRRIGVVLLRHDDETATVVMRATRGDGGVGSIVSIPNRFSPASPAPPPLLGSPIAG
ncbi:MAG: hypothetical protein M3509_14060 [Chloroflexota bacterium]|nr:hypothetical protein [Chloroflexota bacterium]